MVCKGAVPLFFMVSGALLLGKNESGKDLFQKRILRMILVIVIFSFLYYMKLVLKGERPFAPFSFLLSLPTDLVYLPYWFLYSYLGVLTILPILRPLAQNMSKNTFWYLIILQILLDCLKPTAWVLWGYGLCGYYNFSGLFQYVIFYPLIGYGLDQYFSETKFLTPKNIGRNLAVFVAAVLTQMMVYKDYLSVGMKQLADAQGWPTFVVPDDVGGRYSVLTAVGLLPIACAGIDIDALMKGAADAREAYSVCSKDNDAYRYAMTRNILYRKGKVVETLAAFEPDFTMMNEWYKQLFGESEGKDQKGLMPTSCIFSTDLHSMGQFLQDGSRTMFETYVDIKNTREDFYIEPLEGNFDGLNFLADQNMSVVNRKAMEGTILAHNDGGVPIGVIEVDSLDAYNVGYLIYFFWKACAVSGYLLSVNPFDQPGVESYKKNMFALLGKPGYEDRKAELEAKLG